jgi:hypothetical protein
MEFNLSFLAWVVVIVLAVIAALHLYWGFGGFWPGHDVASLMERVAGWERRRAFGLLACAAVAAALTGAAWIVAAQHGAPRLGIPDVLWTFGFWVVFTVFLLRGLAAYTPAFAYAEGTPFFELNRLYYGPLCLAIAGAMAVDYFRTQ